MKTALLITYHWPPSGGAGVHRWLKMSRYMADHGWKLVVFTPSNAEMPVKDNSLLDQIPPGIQIIKHPIREPYSIYKRFTGRKAKENVYSGFISEKGQRSITERLSIWLRGNLFVPDPRKFWIGPAARRLKRLLTDMQVDAVISTGPPHTTHLIAERVAIPAGIPWVADFRDPWTGIDYYSELQLTRFADRKHRRLEHRVLSRCSRVVTVSPSWARDLEQISGRHVDVIHNGFDSKDFQDDRAKLEDEFSICHFGSMNRDRNPIALWEAMAALQSQNHPLMKDLRVNLFGPTDHEIVRTIEKLGLKHYVSLLDYIPHEQAIKRMCSSHVLLLPINRTDDATGVIPGKFYEYLGAKRPVLLIGPRDGDAAKILETTACGRAADFDDTGTVMNALEAFHRDYGKGQLQIAAGSIDRYSRSALAERYAQLLDNLIAEDGP